MQFLLLFFPIPVLTGTTKQIAAPSLPLPLLCSTTCESLDGSVTVYPYLSCLLVCFLGNWGGD